MEHLPFSSVFGFNMCAQEKPVYDLKNYSVMKKVCRYKTYYQVYSCSCNESGRSCSPVSKVIQNYERFEQAKAEADRLQKRRDEGYIIDY